MDEVRVYCPLPFSLVSPAALYACGSHRGTYAVRPDAYESGSVARRDVLGSLAIAHRPDGYFCRNDMSAPRTEQLQGDVLSQCILSWDTVEVVAITCFPI